MNKHSVQGQIAFDIETLINECQPRSLLVIGDQAELFIQDYVAQKRMLGQECSVTSLAIEDALDYLQKSLRFDVCIVTDALEFLDKERAGQLIAALRDLRTDRFLIVVRIGDQWEKLNSTWQTVDLLAYGLKLVNRYHSENKPIHVYKYDILTYKKTPQWLNASNWANPQLWERFRW